MESGIATRIPILRAIPNEEHSTTPIQLYRATVASVPHHLHARHRFTGDRSQQDIPLQWRAGGQSQSGEIKRRGGSIGFTSGVARVWPPAQRARTQPVSLSENRVESAQALKAGRKGDAGYRE